MGSGESTRSFVVYDTGEYLVSAIMILIIVMDLY